MSDHPRQQKHFQFPTEHDDAPVALRRTGPAGEDIPVRLLKQLNTNPASELLGLSIFL